MPFNGRAVWHLRQQWGLPPVATLSRVTLLATEQIVTADEAARLIGVYPTTIYKWLSVGRLCGIHVGKALPWKVVVTPEVIQTLRDHADRVRRVKPAKRLTKEAS